MNVHREMIDRMRSLSREEVDWNAVYAEQLPRVYNYFRYRLGDGPQAEDLTSETFEKAWRHRKRYRRDRAAFSTWLFSIARNLATDTFRRQRSLLSLDEIAADVPARDPAVEDQVQNQQEWERLSVLLGKLPERERELIALKYGAELTNREIARLMDLSETNVGTILHRLVQKLREQWEVPA